MEQRCSGVKIININTNKERDALNSGNLFLIENNLGFMKEESELDEKIFSLNIILNSAMDELQQNKNPLVQKFILSDLIEAKQNFTENEIKGNENLKELIDGLDFLKNELSKKFPSLDNELNINKVEDQEITNCFDR